MKRFQTLMLREWMQQRRGWLILLLTLPVVVLLQAVSGFGIQMDPGNSLAVATITMFGLPMLLLGLACIAVFAMAPGLARRDQQDRSIEFWLSLPVGHSASIGATLLMHLLAMPLLALAVGALSGQVLAHVLVLRMWGGAGWQEVPWSTLLPLALAVFARALLGVVLAALWLAPFALVPMAGSAWLKRWGTPLVLAGVAIAHGVLLKFYGIGVIGRVVSGLLQGGQQSIVFAPPTDVEEQLRANALPITAHWAASDALAALQNLAQPLFAFSLVISAICFGLLVLRRRRGA